uniref:CUB domain-containing protein n=1 Tax=Plectus sambesii TaxID=2011161 RepID=A0A914X638_9BILA
MTTTSSITGTTLTPTSTDPCATKNCTGTLGFPGICSFSGNVATCQCPGNLDPDSCGKVGCINKVNGGQVVNQLGPFWSPGYNGHTGSYGGNLDCQWIMSQCEQQMNITLKAFKTASDATLNIRTTSGNIALSGDLTQNLDLYNRRVQSTINGATTVLFEFTNTNAGSPGDYFDIGFTFI